ncbi:sulfide-quinone oxidoreductase [Gyrodon lividus]|nr:sulfide-quinone oxidoreductase [Gyrodon lividus]
MLVIRGTQLASLSVSRISQAGFASIADKPRFRVVVVGAGSGGLTVAHQIYDRFKDAGTPLNPGDIAVLDAAEYHYYQPGWTLVGAGLRPRTDFRKPLASLFPTHISHIPENVYSLSPANSTVTTTTGRTVAYDSLVVAAGLRTNWDNVKGLQKALADPKSPVSSMYSYDTCDKVYKEINAIQSGKAIFTQPAGVIKCPGAPQKIMWMAWDRFQKTGKGNDINIEFMTGLPTMFSVKKYSDALNALRIERGIAAEFHHNLISVDSAAKSATFERTDGSKVTREYDFLHVTPPMGPLDSIKNSPLADAEGWVNVDPATLQHKKPEFSNVFALGDCSSCPTSKTAAAITSQAPVLTENLFELVDTGKLSNVAYDGYSSCPLWTGYGQVMLAEFKYGFEPKESFSRYFGCQTKRTRSFYYFEKYLFPWVYWNGMIKGKWFGPSGPFKPKFT